MNNNHVLIIGGGPTGLCLSLALAHRGLEVDLVERQPGDALANPGYDGREVALTHVSQRLLRDIGVWQLIDAADTAPLRRARIMDGRAAGFDVDGAAFGSDRLGTLVSNHAIRAAAWKAASAHAAIHLHTDSSVEAATTDDAAAHVRLTDGRTLDAALLVAADSRFSQTRRALGIATHMHDFGQTMLLCRVRHTVANDGTAWEWFGHGQTRALLPLGAHLSSVVLTVPDVEAQALKALPAAEFAAAIATRYEGRLGTVTLEGAIHTYPMVATWARRFVGRRFALAGDAAVGMHPVTAHGFNLALASVEHLAAAAGDGWQRHGDPACPAMLARFERRHRMNSALLFAGTQAIATLFTDERHVAQPLRRAIIGVGRRLPPLRRALAASLIDASVRPGSIPHHLHTALEVLRPRLSGGHRQTGMAVESGATRL